MIEGKEKEKGDEPEEITFYELEKAIFEVTGEWSIAVNNVELYEGNKEVYNEFINRLMFMALEECSNIQDSTKFVKFVSLHQRLFKLLKRFFISKETQDKTPSLFDVIKCNEKGPINDQELIKTLGLQILTSPLIDKQIAIKTIISEYFLFKTLRHKALSGNGSQNLVELFNSLTDADFERPELQPNFTSLVTKMQVFQAFLEESSKLKESDILDIFDRIHNNDILAFHVKDNTDFCKQTLLINKQIIPQLELVFSDSQLLRQITSQTFFKKIIKLPKSFQEFNNIYTRRKCSLCNEFSKHLMTNLCLICGVTICQGNCPSKPTEMGNLNSHALKEHAGACVFVNIQLPFWVIVSSPDAWVSNYKDIYTNLLGESVANKIEDYANLYDIDFSDFQLNQDMEVQVNEVILENSMKKSMYNWVQKEGYYFENFDL